MECLAAPRRMSASAAKWSSRRVLRLSSARAAGYAARNSPYASSSSPVNSWRSSTALSLSPATPAAPASDPAPLVDSHDANAPVTSLDPHFERGNAEEAPLLSLQAELCRALPAW
ncbi:hypothetical protein JYU34_001723 [Plutella xylostella]|uniref:Uncharacterized protein n=1 Tax=Plutella xylostella TaxID=51655 RepID=A0ABQ7R4M3_PLUXY|nr:hypothetical protein JYU34_001723 [Plutella xylostella]